VRPTLFSVSTSISYFLINSVCFPTTTIHPAQALFRPVSMCVPDLALICEVMLMAEGFQKSRELARKFVGLYRLCEGMLSKARHYDWKLRAIKTTLSVAGAMKRSSPPGVSEEKVLLRALRDLNVGKLAGGDAPVFAGLLEDLFPGLPATVPRAADARFEAAAAAAAVKLGYVPEKSFLLKVSQLRELFTVRWSVFLLGPPGSGKTAVWRTLQAAQLSLGEATDVAVLNPKAVTRDELYGCSQLATGEWRDGLLSRCFRDFATDKTKQHQWLVLDGDIDPEWIESMNTVMDDNRVLTLASNERIPLAAPMRLLLEIDSMAHCSPATVSRGGVVFVNGDEGVGGGGGGENSSTPSSSSAAGGVWKPALESWVSSLGDAELRSAVRGLVDK
jgi:dynein heavy chain, axonemal